jgi:hypothetical protein
MKSYENSLNHVIQLCNLILTSRKRMYRKSAVAKHAESIHKMISNGYRFVVMQDGKIQEKYRYKYEADRHKRKGISIIPIESLLEY